MSRDVFYMVSSESDGRNDQQAAATSEPINNRQRDESNAGTTADLADQNENIEANGAEERIRPLIKERVYYAAKDGLPIALTSLLSSVESETTKNAYINQVSLISILHATKCSHHVVNIRFFFFNLIFLSEISSLNFVYCDRVLLLPSDYCVCMCVVCWIVFFCVIKIGREKKRVLF